MTKIEPLKGKVLTDNNIHNKYDFFEVCTTKDIRSAVEWIKEEFHKSGFEFGCNSFILSKIDEAFEDVMNGGDGDA